MIPLFLHIGQRVIDVSKITFIDIGKLRVIVHFNGGPDARLSHSEAEMMMDGIRSLEARRLVVTGVVSPKEAA